MTLESDTFLEFAKDSIENNGASIIYRKILDDSYNTETGELESENTNYAIKGLIESYSEYFISQNIVKSGDRKITIAAASLSVKPSQGDQIIIGAEVFEIQSFKTEFAEDTPIIYIFQVRN